MHAEQLRTQIIRPVLLDLGLASLAAENLILGTAAQESRMGHYLKQLGKGPALGIFQMEPATHNDIWQNYLAYHQDLAGRIWSYLPSAQRIPDPQYLVWNLKYAAAMCRVHYRRVKEPLPHATDIHALAEYWKRHYNTSAGRGTESEFVSNYLKYVEVAA